MRTITFRSQFIEMHQRSSVRAGTRLASASQSKPISHPCLFCFFSLKHYTLRSDSTVDDRQRKWGATWAQTHNIVITWHVNLSSTWHPQPQPSYLIYKQLYSCLFYQPQLFLILSKEQPHAQSRCHWVYITWQRATLGLKHCPSSFIKSRRIILMFRKLPLLLPRFPRMNEWMICITKWNLFEIMKNNTIWKTEGQDEVCGWSSVTILLLFHCTGHPRCYLH